MVSNFRIFMGLLSGYVSLGLLYNMIKHYIISHIDLRIALKIVIERPLYIRILDRIFYPINEVMNYFTIKQILEEEAMGDLEDIFDDEEDYYEE